MPHRTNFTKLSTKKEGKKTQTFKGRAAAGFETKGGGKKREGEKNRKIC